MRVDRLIAKLQMFAKIDPDAKVVVECAGEPSTIYSIGLSNKGDCPGTRTVSISVD